MVKALYESGTFGARPAAGVQGRIYEGTDTDIVYLDTGAEWLDLATATELATLIAQSSYSPSTDHLERISRFYVSGTLRPYARIDHLVEFTSFRMKRLQVALNDAPSGADASNHFSLNITDGTTSVDFPIDTDSLVYEFGLSLLTRASATTSASASSGNNDRGNLFTVSSEITIKVMTIHGRGAGAGTRTWDYAILDADNGNQVLAQGQEVKALPGTDSEIDFVLSSPVTLSPGTNYWFAIMSDATGVQNWVWTHASSGNPTYTNMNIIGGYNGDAASFASFSNTHTQEHWMKLKEPDYPEFHTGDRGLDFVFSEIGTAPADPGADATITMVIEELVDAPTPLATGGLISWYDASQQAGYSDADPIQTLTDFSGTGLDLVCSNGGSQNWPIYNTNGVAAGLPSIHLGVAGAESNTSMPIGSDLTFFAVTKAPTNGVLLEFSNLSPERKILLHSVAGGTEFQVQTNPGTRAESLGDRTVWHTVSAAFSPGQPMTTYYNRVAGETVATAGAHEAVLAAPNQRMRGSSAGTNWEFAEVLVFNRALTADEMATIWAYLESKWGLA